MAGLGLGVGAGRRPGESPVAGVGAGKPVAYQAVDGLGGGHGRAVVLLGQVSPARAAWPPVSAVSATVCSCWTIGTMRLVKEAIRI